MLNNQNLVSVVGILTNVRVVWSSLEHKTYEGIVEVYRDSGIIDYVPIIVKDTVIDQLQDKLVSVVGQFRSRDIDNNGKLKVELYVYVSSITTTDSVHRNDIHLTGFVCKRPSLRTTPSGKQITDLLIACNYSKDKTAYLPVVTWGKNARTSGKYTVGTQVSIDGRIQSRMYTKEIDNNVQTFVVREISATSIE